MGGLDVEVDVKLMTDDGQVVSGKNGPSVLWYSVGQKKYPEGGRLASSWQVRVIKACGLPGSDGITVSTSDPFVRVTGVTESGDYTFHQYSCVVPTNCNPE